MTLYVGPVPDPDEEFYVPKEAARCLGVSRARITQMIAEGKLDAYKVRHHLFIPAKQVDARCHKPDPHGTNDPLEKQSA